MARPDETRQAATLFALFTYLQSCGLFEDGPEEKSIPLDKVARDMGQSTGDAEKAIERLACCGQDTHFLIPLYLDEVDGEKRVFGSPFPAPKYPLRLSLMECVALCKALEPFGGRTSNAFAGELLSKTATPDFSANALDNLSLEVEAENDEHLREHLDDIRKALLEQRILHMGYRTKGRADVEMRDVEPLALYLDRGLWYLEAYCHKREEVRTFSVERIAYLNVSAHTFPARDFETVRFSKALAGDMPTATLSIEPGTYIEKREWPGITLLGTDADGRTLARIPYAGSAWLPCKVVSYLGAVKVVEPAALADEVADRARERSAMARDTYNAWDDIKANRIGSPDIYHGSTQDDGSWKARLAGTLGHIVS